jgi:hypothetical protein
MNKIVTLFLFPTPFPTRGGDLGKNVGCAISGK